jgi:hypothetical protein
LVHAVDAARIALVGNIQVQLPRVTSVALTGSISSISSLNTPPGVTAAVFDLRWDVEEIVPGPILTHLVKQSFDDIATTISTTATPITAYTVTWAELQAAGFAAGDTALVLVGVKHWGSSDASNTFFAVGYGATFATRSEIASSFQRAESPNAGGPGEQYLWFGTRALVSGENIYFRGQTTAGTASYSAFGCMIARVADFPADAILFAEKQHLGDAPLAYDFNGASVVIPAAGDWFLLARVRALVDGTVGRCFLAIHDGTADVSEVSTEGEDLADERVFATIAYRAGLPQGTTLTTRYKIDGGTHDVVDTAILGLRLNAFMKHAGGHTATPIEHTATHAYQEFADLQGAISAAAVPFVVVGWPIHETNEQTKRPIGRLRLGGQDWPQDSANARAVADNGSNVRIAPLLFGYSTEQVAGNFHAQVAETFDVDPPYSCVEQVAVTFDLQFAGL